MRIALGQMEIIPGRPDLNYAAMIAMITQAKAQQADMIVFPELAIPGYMVGDTWEQSAFLRDCEQWGNKIIDASDTICIIFGNVAIDWDKRGHDGRPRKYNACFIAYQGRLWGTDNYLYPFRIKTLLPNYREFDDARHFYSTKNLASELGVPIKDLLQPVHIEIKQQRLALGCILCEDGWPDNYSISPIQLLAQKEQLNLLINISCSPFTVGKNTKRHQVFSQQTKKLSVPLIYVNNVGLQNNGKTVYTFDGCSAIYNPKGDIIYQAAAFAPGLTVFPLEYRHESLPVPNDTGIDSICHALRYGINGFLQSITMEKVVIGLSGGIDSAVSAALFATILPPDKLLLVNMPSRYNSQTTMTLAEKLASRLGAWYTTVPIQTAVDLTNKQITDSIVKNKSGDQLTLSLTPFMLENVQARDRSSRVLASIAAAFGGGFTCNANKSELTVGYATLYGDQSGFLAPLADLWKHQIYALGSYLNESIFGEAIIPEGIFQIVPSAELSPHQAVDEGKGDPIIYGYHDYLFRSFTEYWDRATPEDILNWYHNGTLEANIGCEPGLITTIFPETKNFIDDLERWWRLYTGIAVAKRIQAPPIMAVSRRAYGFDHREAQNQPYFTAAYYEIKQALLKQ